MGIERTAQYISQLVPGQPESSEYALQGAEHLQIIKRCVQQSFPNVDREVTLTAEYLNAIPVTLEGLDAELDIHLGSGTAHPASSITWDSSSQDYATAGDVQGAIEELWNYLRKWTETDWPNYLVASMPVGHILLSVNSANPETYLLFGTWQRVGQGHYIASEGAYTDPGGVDGHVSIGSQDGYWGQYIGTDNLPDHQHLIETHFNSAQDGQAANDYFPDTLRDWLQSDVPTWGGVGTLLSGPNERSGAQQPLYTYPPYIGVYMWQRVA